MGNTGYRTGNTMTGHTGHATTGHTGHTATGGYNDPTGPHSSHMANKADPRVDSDRVGGYGNTASTGGYGNTASTGAYDSTTGSTGIGSTGGHHLPGPASKTAGPHSSDMANKIDPRVDSDLDGSKTMGGNRTLG